MAEPIPDPARVLEDARNRLAALGDDDDAQTRAEVEIDMGEALNALGRHQEAEDAFRAALARLEEGHEQAPRAQLGRSRSLWLLGRHHEAREAAEAAWDAFGERNNPLEQAKADVVLANMHHHDLSQTDVLTRLDRARAIFIEHGEPLRAARADTSAANALAVAGRHSDARERYLKARDTFHEAADELGVATCEANLAILHHTHGEFQRAVATGTRARDIYRAHERSTFAAYCELNLSEVLIDMNRDRDALTVGTRALEHFAREGMAVDRALAAINVGRAHGRLGERRRAREVLESAVADFDTAGMGALAAQAEVDLALLDWQEGRPAEARAESARGRLEAAGAPAYSLFAAFVAARVMEERSASEALQRYAQLAESAARLQLPWLIYRARHRMSVLFDATHDLDAAHRASEEAVARLQDIRSNLAGDPATRAFMADKTEVFEHGVALRLKRGDVDGAFQLAEGARSAGLVEGIASGVDLRGLAAGRPAPIPALWDQLEDIRAELATLSSSVAAEEEVSARDGDGPLVAAARRSVDLSTRFEHIRAQLRDSGAEDLLALRVPNPLDPAQTARLLKAHERYVSFFVCQDQILGFAVAPDGTVWQGRCGSLQQITRLILDDWYGEIEDAAFLGPDGRAALCPAADQVLDELGQALLGFLPDGWLEPVRRIIVAPHGPIHRVPFGALRSQGAYLLDSIEVVHVPGAAIYGMLAERKTQAPTAPALVVSAADEQAPLLATEARAVARLLPNASLLEGKDAQIERVEAAARGAAHLHIASHGEFDALHPLASGLRLADGRWRAADILRNGISAPITVLSGCETGRSELAPGDELLGLLRGWLLAGSRTVVASLWPVSDPSSATLMEDFYVSLSSDVEVATALTSAQRALKRRYTHPYDWAGFCPYGRGDTRPNFSGGGRQ